MILKIILSLLILPLIHGENITDTEDQELIRSHIRRDLRFMDLVKYDGYEAESHTVTTDDGYILTIFHVKSRCETKGEPVIFMHGLYLSADDCIIAGPGVALCYLFADACRDVYAFNIRGNVYSRNHTTLDPDKDRKFWDFGIEEISYSDMPCSIDYVLNQTGSDHVYFVGHSQGVTMLLLLCAKHPEYNSKIKAGFGLSTTAWLYHARFIVVKLQGILKLLLTTFVNSGLNMEILPRDGFYQPIIKALCGTTNESYDVCYSQFYYAVLGNNKGQITPSTFRVMTGHLPSGTSLKIFTYWGHVRVNGFTRFDYGLIGNLKAYGRATPPEFDLSKVSMKWIFFGSENDYVSDPKDLETLMGKVSNAVKCILADKTFGHLDFNYGKDIPNYIFPSIIGYMTNGTVVCY